MRHRDNRNRMLTAIRRVERIFQLEGDIPDHITKWDVDGYIAEWPSKNEIGRIVWSMVNLNRRQTDIEKELIELGCDD